MGSRLERAWLRALAVRLWDLIDWRTAGELLSLGRWGYTPVAKADRRLRALGILVDDGRLTELGKLVFRRGRRETRG